MVDAVNLVFVETSTELPVQFLCRGEVMAERFFHHDATVRCGDAELGQAAGDWTEKRWGDREVERSNRVGLVVDQCC